MSARSKNSKKRTSKATGESAYSTGLPAGPTPLSLPDGPQTDLFGQPLAPVSRSARPGKGKESETSGTFGQFCPPSSASVALTACLANKLVDALDTNGSMEYELTWKRKTTPSGLRIYRLQAKGRPISEADCSGWLSPTVEDAGRIGSLKDWQKFTDSQQWSGARLRNQVQTAGVCPTKDSIMENHRPLSGWPTPMAGTPATEEYNEAGNTDSGRKTVELVAGWPTCKGTDGDKGARTHRGAEKELDRKGPGADLPTIAASVAGWATPIVNDATGSQYAYGRGDRDKKILKLPGQAASCQPSVRDAADYSSTENSPSQESFAKVAGWATPAARDHKSESATEEFNAKRDAETRGKPLSYEATLSGPTASSSPAETVSGEECHAPKLVLNHRFSLWLQGYPAEWASCAERGIASAPKRRRRS